MKNSFIIALCLLTSVLCPLTSDCADQTLAVAPKMTAAERAETVIPAGVIVRDADNPAAAYMGDGITPGGHRIGDGIGWQEGTTLTQDLNVGAHRINLGNWSLLTLGGWGAISGGTAEVSPTGVFQLSVLGNIFMEAVSEQSLVSIESFRWVPPYFEITTPLGDVQPTILFTASLTDLEWVAVTVVEVVTNETTLVFKVEQPETVGYFRATIPSGSGSAVDFKATLKQNGEPVALAGDLSGVESGLLDVGGVASNAWNTATNNAALIAVLPTNPVTSIILNGVTNDPTAGTVDLGTLVTALQDGGSVNGTNRTATLHYDFTNNWWFTEVTDE